MSWNPFGGSYSMGIYTLYWLDSRNDQIIEQLPASVNWTSNSIIGMGFQPWSAWKGEATAQNIIQPGGSYIDTKNYETENTAKSHISQMFMGVREVMKMKYQSDPNPYEAIATGAGRAVSILKSGGIERKTNASKHISRNNHIIITDD